MESFMIQCLESRLILMHLIAKKEAQGPMSCRVLHAWERAQLRLRSNSAVETSLNSRQNI